MRPSTPDEAIAYFSSLPASSIRLGLDRVEMALEALGNPQERVPALHVAGTNGKGSTCAFAASVLRAQGYRVGLYTSPHLVRVNERIRVGGADISDQMLGQRILEVLARYPAAAAEPYPLTYFELGTVVALWHFAQEQVQIAVLETGLGGRLDATSVCRPWVTAVTSISYDHTEYLGGTLQSIAREKAGIFKPNVPALSSEQLPEAAAALADRAQELHIPLYVEGRDFRMRRAGAGWDWSGRQGSLSGLTLGLRGSHQGQNAAVALACLEVLAERGLPTSPEAIRRGLAEVVWPGRLEEISQRPTVLLDGAHNPGGVEVLLRALKEIYPNRAFHCVFGVLADKDREAMMTRLFPEMASLHLCPVDSPRSVPPEQYLPVARALCPNVQSHGSVAEALDGARKSASEEDVILCTGSLYVVGEVRGLTQRG